MLIMTNAHVQLLTLLSMVCPHNRWQDLFPLRSHVLHCSVSTEPGEPLFSKLSVPVHMQSVKRQVAGAIGYKICPASAAMLWYTARVFSTPKSQPHRCLNGLVGGLHDVDVLFCVTKK